MSGKLRKDAGVRIRVRRATPRDTHQASSISRALRREVARGTHGMASRSPGSIRKSMEQGRAVLALDGERWVGFCYVSPWEGGKFVSTSALLVRPRYRRRGVGRRLKKAALLLCRQRFPESRPFGLTTSETVAEMNRQLGFRIVGYDAIPRDPGFWKACKSCPFHGILRRHRGRRCHCTAMLL